jgi:phage shock protein C
MDKKFHRIPSEGVLGGVAAGMADYFNIDKSIIRVLWVASLLLPIPPTFGWTFLIYIILWAVLPEGTATPQSFAAHEDGNTFFGGSDKKQSQTVKILGIALIVFGGIMLVDELPLWYQIKHYFWPAGLIVLGIYLILNQKDKAAINSQQDTTIITPPPASPDPTPFQPDPTAPKEDSTPSLTTFEPDPNAPHNKPDSEEGDGDIIKVN